MGWFGNGVVETSYETSDGASYFDIESSGSAKPRGKGAKYRTQR